MMMCPPVRPALAEKAFPIGHPTSAESFGSPATTQAQDVTLLRWEDPNADAARLRQVVPLNSALLYGGWLDLETDPYVCRWLGPDGAIINPEPDLTIEEVRLRITSVYGADKPLLSATFAGHGKEASVTVKSAYGADRPVLDCSFVELRSEAPANTASRPSAMLPLLHLSLRDVGLDVAALVSSEPPPEGNGWIVRLMPRLLSRRFGSIHLKPFVSELRQRSATTWNEEHRCMCLSGITFIYASHLSAGTSKQEIMDRN